MPGAGPGFSQVEAGPEADDIKQGLVDHELDALLLVDSNPVRTFPDGPAWSKALAGTFVAAISMFDDESTKHADIVLPAESYAEKEGTVTHPDGRLQRVRPNVPLPENTRPGWWILSALLAELGYDLGVGTPEEVFELLCDEVPFYGETAYEEIGAQGLRWQERDPGTSWIPSGASASPTPASQPHTPAGASSTAGAAKSGTSEEVGLMLGTYRDLWASEVTERNPALRFLMPTQRLEMHPADAEGLGLAHGDPVTVTADGASVEAFVSVKSRMRPGAAFLIEGTGEQNGNVLAGGEPRRIEVSKRELPPGPSGNGLSNGNGRVKVVETPMPTGGVPN